jgi:DUF971 family protein
LEARHGQRTTDNGQGNEFTLQVTPKKIKLAGENSTLTVQWSDGHTSAYPYGYLRSKCPCATCHESAALPEKPPSPFPMFGVKPLRPDRAQLVGRYAVQIFWNDGHSTGIYSFDYLRGLCPCPECAAGREATSTSD